MRRLTALMSLCAACGRIDFAARGGGNADGGLLGDGTIVPPDRVVLSLLADTTRAPIANATVLVDRGTSIDRMATDASGALSIATTSPIDLAVAFSDASGWRVYSVLAVPPGTAVGLGGRNVNPTATLKMTVSAPSTSATEYGLTLPGMCGNGDVHYGGPAMTISYLPSCEGTSYHLWTFATPSAGNRDVIDAGTVTLANGTTKMVQGTWTPLAATSIAISNVPASVTDAVATLGILDTTGFLATSESGSATIAGTNASAKLHTPSANALEIDLPSSASVPYGGDSAIVMPMTLAPALAFDAATMLPEITAMSLPPAANVASWTVDASATVATATAFDATVNTPALIEWTVFAPGGTTSVAFPSLPADLAAADPTGGTWNFVVAAQLGYAGKTYAGTLADLDASWIFVDQTTTLPAAANAVSDIVYTSALGPP